MKKYTWFIALLMLSGCEWIITHPTEDAEIVKLAEEAATDLYKYETGPKPIEPPPVSSTTQP